LSDAGACAKLVTQTIRWCGKRRAAEILLPRGAFVFHRGNAVVRAPFNLGGEPHKERNMTVLPLSVGPRVTETLWLIAIGMGNWAFGNAVVLAISALHEWRDRPR